MSHLALYLLGPPTAELSGELVHIGRRKSIALLAYFALNTTPQSRDALATLLWPGYDQARARGHLRRSLYALGKALGPAWLAAEHETLALNPYAELWLDVAEFRQRLAACGLHADGHPQEAASPDCQALLAETVGLYRGDFLTGFTLPDSPPFDEWQRWQTQGLRDELARALERQGDSVKALCSGDGEAWYTAGSVEFPFKGDPEIQVGLHAIGNIDRSVYHGAYPDGTAIRFALFEMWGMYQEL